MNDHITTLLSNDDIVNRDNEMDGEQGFLLPDGKSQLRKDGGGVDICHEGVIIAPTPGFVLKTRGVDEKKSKVFINICYHDEVEPPGQKKKIDNDGKEIECLNVPLSMSPIRICEDKMTIPCLVADTIVHPSVKDDMERDQTGAHRDLLCTIILQCFDQKYANCAPLDRKYSLPRLSYIGYIDSKSGQVVRKQSDQTEVYKQNVRKRKKVPRIEEINLNTSSKSTPLRVGSSRQETSKEKSLEVNFNNLEYQIYIKVLMEDEMSLDCFMEVVNQQLFEIAKESALTVASIAQKKGLTLLLNSRVTEKLVVSSIRVSFNLPPIDCCSIQVESSAYMFYVNGSTFQATQVILPFCIDLATTTAIYDNKASTLNIEASVVSNKIEEDIDVGSRPWVLARGLSTTPRNDKQSRRNEEDLTSKHVSSPKQIQNEDNNDFSDPYHIRSLYLETSKFGSKGKHMNDTDDSDEKLPEDGFHANDILSQHWMDQQEKERQEKLEKRDTERKERTSNDSVEYVNTNDFKPGGKYHDSNVVSGDDSNNVDLVQAEAVLRRKYNSSLKGTMWSHLF